MNDIILHHFDASPFAEKVRVALGIKALPWHSVEIPMVMPKPDLTLLTGGYRKTPVMQIGSDIYCDTQRIAQELEARFDGAELYSANTRALCESLSSWSDIALFRPGAGLSMGTNPELPEEVLSDRFAFFDFLDRAELPGQLEHLYSQLIAGFYRLSDMLSDGRPFLLGESPSWADASCYASVWMCRWNIKNGVDVIESIPFLHDWEQRIAAIGHGKQTSVSSEKAFETAQASSSQSEACMAPGAYPALSLGQRVSVEPDDYGAVAVFGELHRLTPCEVAVRRHDQRLGDLVVHFPRLGYKVKEV